MLSLFTTAAFAHQPAGESSQVLVSKLVDFESNQPWLGNINEGSVMIDFYNGTLQLRLVENVVCEPNMACIELAPQVHNIQLNVVETFTDGCGATIYVAEKDKTPVDGLKEVVTVYDYQYMVCEIAVPYLTQVTYETFNPWTQQTILSSFGGEELFLLPEFHN